MRTRLFINGPKWTHYVVVTSLSVNAELSIFSKKLNTNKG